MGLDILVDQRPALGVVSFDAGEHRTTFESRATLLVQFQMLVRLRSFHEDAWWDVDELPGLRKELVEFTHRAVLDRHLTSKLHQVLSVLDEAQRAGRPLIAVAD